ncbi:BolA/IbaG family iron-sulfur metabolism protein [Ketobacter sp. MCCC 1A13808]|uniref:BolA family protein n=1 Tax=Ketobacter sp. MCCC 1A13808 TaxID=2602738 RepID=UPI000F261DE0|nr:BolA/IbaG family iron-sulfur metabolism protein [Ketobacter sp. MCCC 1A13808]MVF11237.1 BolA/IbaG family iron-sulfur metabolism protein [Ketobacter sp. MCCC 1A13808]RLP53632.1 MAG: BolA/IbaG family iron-sulfur metabolism protein [Ketobacter sp.]
MITAEDIKQQIESGIDTAEVLVRLDGNKCLVAVASTEFEGLRTIKKQQMVYACLNEMISSGELHAVSMHTYTPSEWDSQKKLGIPGF